MSSKVSDSSRSEFDKFSKEHRWYHKEPKEDYLSPEARKLLEEYSHIAPEDVDVHVMKMRDILWQSAPYPCIGGFKFLTLSLPTHPFYPRITSLLANPSNLILDFASCVAQELRSLGHAGIPSSQLYGSDIVPSFLSTSYQLFNDKERFAGTLVAADVLDEDVLDETGAFGGWEGKFKIVHAGLFLHLFGWEDQVRVCRAIIKLLKAEPGSLFVGRTVGTTSPGEQEVGAGEEKRTVMLHDSASFLRLWNEAVGPDEMRKWKVESWLRIKGEQNAGDKGNGSFFQGDGSGMLTFGVERL